MLASQYIAINHAAPELSLELNRLDINGFPLISSNRQKGRQVVASSNNRLLRRRPARRRWQGLRPWSWRLRVTGLRTRRWHRSRVGRLLGLESTLRHRAVATLKTGLPVARLKHRSGLLLGIARLPVGRRRGLPVARLGSHGLLPPALRLLLLPSGPLLGPSIGFRW